MRRARFWLHKLKLRLFPPPYEPEVVAAIKLNVHPGAACVDVGAHVGVITTVMAAAAGRHGRVVAFEAYPPNADKLRETLFKRGLGWVTVENIAVTDGAERTVSLHSGRDRRAAEWNVMGHDVEGRRTSPELDVPATSLDDYFRSGEALDFAKIDVEGAEGLVLAGMQRMLREAHPVVMVEFHDEHAWEERRHLLEAGYSLETLAGDPVAPDSERVYHCLARPPAA